MDVLRIALHILILYGFYLFGTWIQSLFHLTIPGSIIGMFCLFILLATKIINPKWIELGTSYLLTHMQILFIPVTAGILNFLDVFSGKGFLLIVVTVISTIIVFISSGLVSQALAVKGERQNG